MKQQLDSLVRLDRRHIIGLMSGTSADGVDAALLEVRGYSDRTEWELLAFETRPFDAPVRREILALHEPEASRVLERLARLHFRLGEIHADACEAVASRAGYSLDEIHLAGMHGQTMFHGTGGGAVPGAVDQPSVPGAVDQPSVPGPGGSTRALPSAQPGHAAGPLAVPATLQITEAAVLAERTGLSVVSNFRARDVAAGGTGAPLVPYVDYLLFHSEDEARLCLNIGGIANFTALPRGASADEVIAFDTGPGNMVIDALVARYTGGRESFDRDGQHAARAAPSAELLMELMAHDFIARRPPKSAGREEFGAQFAERLAGRATALKLSESTAISTATQFTVLSVAEAYRLHVLTRTSADIILVSGGGVHNRTLMDRLSREMAPAPVQSTAEYGLDPDAKEAVAFALLANEAIHGRAANLPAVTGATHPVILGAFVPGRVV